MNHPTPSYADGMEHLVATMHKLSMARDIHRIGELVCQAARSLAGADGATFILRDGEECSFVDADGSEPLGKGRRLPMTACASGWAMLHREVVVIDDVKSDARVATELSQPTLPTWVKSLAVMPIRMADPIGAIGVSWVQAHRASEADLRLLRALAESTSIAIDNVTLLGDLRAAKEAADEASQLKDEFLARVSHELRTPLNTIVGWSSILSQRRLADADLQNAAQTIHRAAHAQAKMIDDLLDASRIVSGKLQLDIRMVDLAPVVAAVIDSLSAAATAKNLTIHRPLEASAAPVRGDAERLRQVVWQLVSNAVKFTPACGAVTVSLRRVDARIELVVADTGVGLAPEFLPHVFDRFRKGDGSNTRRSGGLGVGLSIVRHLVELHGATVRAESEGVGKGATFTLSMPAASANSTEVAF